MRIGTGTYGMVYRALDKGKNKLVALKRIMYTAIFLSSLLRINDML
jgi:serine/threonine protein kinase